MSPYNADPAVRLHPSLASLVSDLLGTDQYRASPVNQSSFSGSEIYRVQWDGGVIALKSWPFHPDTIAKVDFWQNVNVCYLRDERSSQSGYLLNSNKELYNPVPRLLNAGLLGGHLGGLAASHATAVTTTAPHPSNFVSPLWHCNGQYWTVSEWVPGKPLSNDKITQPLKWKFIEFLCDFHLKTNAIGASKGLSIGMAERLAVCEWLSLGAFEAYRTLSKLPSVSNGVQPLVARLAQILEWGITQRQQLQRRMEFLSNKQWSLHWIVRDFWRENVLFDEQTERMYLVDFGASRCDLPVFDFVRLLGSLRCNLSDWGNAIALRLDKYDMTTELELGEFLLLHRLSTLGSIRYWCGRLNKLFSESDTPSQSPIFKAATTRLHDIAENWL